MDLTKEGYENKKGHNYYGSPYHTNNKKRNSHHTQESTGSSMGGLILLAAVGLVIYALYRTCIAPAAEQIFQSR
jgi:hypothetical protein